MIKAATMIVAGCAAFGLAGLSATADTGPDTYSASVSTVAFDGPLEPGFFRGYNSFAFDDASDGHGPVLGIPAVLLDADGTPLFNSEVIVTNLGGGTFSVTATLSAVADSLFDSIPQTAMKINGDGGALTANGLNFTVGNVLGFPGVERDGIDIGTEWTFVDGEVRLSGVNQDEVFDHVQFFHPSDIEGATLTDVHLGYNLAMGILESTRASSMSITVKVASVAGPVEKSFTADTQLDSTPSSAAREGIFVLNAATAKIREGKLVLSGVRTNVLAFEPDVRPLVGVSELAERFLTRWSTTEHSINPAALLMSHSLTSEEAYRTLALQIDHPVKNGLDEWIFEVGPMTDQPRDFPTLSVELSEVTITVVMSHSPREFALGHVCGPWTPEALKGHAEVAESVAGDAR